MIGHVVNFLHHIHTQTHAHCRGVMSSALEKCFVKLDLCFKSKMHHEQYIDVAVYGVSEYIYMRKLKSSVALFSQSWS